MYSAEAGNLFTDSRHGRRHYHTADQFVFMLRKADVSDSTYGVNGQAPLTLSSLPFECL